MRSLVKERGIFLQSIGLDPDDALRWASKWQNLRSHSKSRGAVCNLTFEEYMGLVCEAGINNPDQIGRKAHLYQMGRIGDTGNYELGNCRFITMAQNAQEKLINGGYEVSDSQRKRVAEFHGKRYRVVSPDGEVFEGKNLNQFCKEHGLDQGNMSGVCNGHQKHSKGWTGVYL